MSTRAGPNVRDDQAEHAPNDFPIVEVMGDRTAANGAKSFLNGRPAVLCASASFTLAYNCKFSRIVRLTICHQRCLQKGGRDRKG
eukprot:SM000346S12851  [mRNA]  locus=s346:70606:70860:+ [translate_table: standard]